MGKQMSEQFRALSWKELREELEVRANTLVLFHRAPDGDAVGSAFALRHLLTGLGSRAHCVCCEEVPERLRFLSDGVQESVLPASIPEDFEVQRIISVDVASPAQLGELWELYGERVDLMLDHHGMGEVYADNYIRPDCAATGEIIFDLVKEAANEGKYTITDEVCVDLYAAISSDTGCFRYSNVTSETHLRASELVASGIDCARVNQMMFEQKSLEQLRAQAAGISNLHLFADGKIAVVLFPYALKAALGLEEEHLGTLVDVARSLRGVEVAVSIRQPSTEGRFRVSLRCTGDFDAAELCAQFGGGGHKKAAGCTVTAENADEAMNKIISAMNFQTEN